MPAYENTKLLHFMIFPLIDKCLKAILGNAIDYPITNRLFTISCFLCFVFSFISIFNNLITGLPLITVLIASVFSVVFFRLYVTSKKITNINLLTGAFAITVTAITNGLWFVNGGIASAVPMYFLIASIFFISTMPKKYFISICVLMVLNLTLLSCIEYFYPHLITYYPNRTAQFIDIGLSIGFGVIVTSIYIGYLRLNYDYERHQVDKHNDSLQLSQAELTKAIDKAETASKAKANFLSVMSHELRTPMNAVVGMTHLLMEEKPTPAQMDKLRILKFSADQLLVLINDILDFSKIEAGKIDFEQVSFNLHELLCNIHLTLSPLADDKGLKFRVLTDGKLPEKVVGDPNRLAQIINNLTSNAIKFTQEGTVTIKADLVEKNGFFTTIHFQVEDTGIGISAEQMEKIFDNFSQASSDTTRKFGGTGLGLTITKRLLELQNSAIQLDSEVGKGSCFHFKLQFKTDQVANISVPKNAKPQKTIDLAPPQQAVSSSSNVSNHKNTDTLPLPPAPKSKFKDVRVLLAEDHKVNVVVVSNFLKKWNIEFDVAQNGLVALEKVQENTYNLILMDLQMPEMDGYRATREIRKLEGEQFEQLPIIGLTASAVQEIMEEAMKVGMTDYITKPFQPDELYDKIAKYA